MVGENYLDRAIATIDDLVRRLQTGEFSSAATASSVNGTVKAPPSDAAHRPEKAKKTALNRDSISEPASANKPAPAAASGPVEGAALFSKAHLVVARVLSAEAHPNSEKLYITRLDVGGGQVRQVVAGLRKYITTEELVNSLVVVVLNLKPAKLAGELSEGMILASSSPGRESSGEEGNAAVAVKPIRPSEDAAPGEALHLEGQTVEGSETTGHAKQLKGDHWRKIAASLTVSGEVATLDGIPLASRSGKVMAKGFPDGSTIS